MTKFQKFLRWVPILGLFLELGGENYLSNLDNKPRFYLSAIWHALWFSTIFVGLPLAIVIGALR
jgi:hypothetical protein